jgi:hypothetical protein
MHGAVPHTAEWWSAQQSLASQLGLQALLCHLVGLRATCARSLTIEMDSSSIELQHFDPLPLSIQVGPPVMPFRLTRSIQHFLTPLGVDGRFSGALRGAAECMAQAHKCPLGLWLDFLSQLESSEQSLHYHANVPWNATGIEAESRACDLSPDVARSRGQSSQRIVHVCEHVQMLIARATSADHLQRMPPAWMAWL